MFGNIVVRTKFIAPVLNTGFFPRKNLNQLFEKISQYPVTLIQAGPGYGKSTALAHYFSDKENVFWYSVGKGDGDVLTFLLHNIYAFNTANSEIGEKTLNYVREKGKNDRDWIPVINSLINELWDQYRYQELYLVIDDYHLLHNQDQVNELMEYFIEHRPPKLHIVISTRMTPDFSNLTTWRVKDQILEIGEEDLRLCEVGIGQFFSQQYNHQLSPEQVSSIYDLTEGWIMALEMLRQGIGKDGKLDKIKNKPMKSLQHLFHYLAQEIISKQNERIGKFFIKTSLLRVMTPESCDFIREEDDSEEIIRYLVENGLFTFELDFGQYRYHHLFHDFLKDSARKELSNLDVLHKEVAEYFLNRDDLEEAIYHFLEGGDYFTAARILSKIGPKLIQTGRFITFTEWFKLLPERIIESFPNLYLYKGDIARFTSNYKEALEWYNQGRRILKNKKDKIGLSLAFQKMAMIYLDTVQPSRADKYLKKAIELREKEANWDELTLLRLMAENFLNRGQLEKARKMQDKYHKLNKEKTNYFLDSRVKIRTGRVHEAAELLEQSLEESEQRKGRIGLAHREIILLLSLIASFKGKAEKSLDYAKLGLRQAEKLQSPFTQAVAYMRLGHAYQVNGVRNYKRAIRSYEEALVLVDEMEVRRGRGEALWGLTSIYGHLGHEARMKRYGLEGIEICEDAGDEWLAALIKLALGIGYLSIKDYKNATNWLTNAVKTYDSCNDLFGKVMGQIWLTLIDCRLGNDVDFKKRLEEIVPVIKERDLSFIFTNVTLLGARDTATFLPILTKGYNLGIKADFCKYQLEVLSIEPGIAHPGYTLKIKTLGQFEVMRGKEEIINSEWKRKKARTLFQIFLTYKDELLPKEKLATMLSPNKSEKAAQRDFKVVLNALNNVLEPNREARAKPFFINKKSSRYGLNINTSCEIDIIQFESLVNKGLNLARDGEIEDAIEDLSDGIKLYQGIYLPDALYEDWAREERERLKSLFLQGAEMLANLYYREEEYHLALQMADRILSEDIFFEEGYQLLMKAYYQQGKRSRAIQTYHKCCEILNEELGVEPTQKTIQIYNSIKNATSL